MFPVSEFESATENAALKRAIIERIERRGPIPFRDFMQMALYEPGLGYYCSPREKMGRAGDYLTSPVVTPIFGAMVGRQLREMWALMERPAEFTVVEAGAGTGALARDILRWSERTAPEFAAALRYTIAEPNPEPGERQRRALAAEGLDGRVAWSDGLPEGVEGCILSNELLDSMPVHIVRVDGGRLREMYTGWDGAAFTEEAREPSTPEIAAYFERLGLMPGEGCRAEVNLAAPAWTARAASALSRGFVLTIDYGYQAAELYAPWRQDGTLMCFYRHNPGNDPYARIGRQDMTSHVDFTTLCRTGEEAGLQTLGLVPQSEFLANLGIGDALTPGEGPGLEEYYARRRAVLELLDTAGLGRIRVLAQSRGVTGARLTGLGGA